MTSELDANVVDPRSDDVAARDLVERSFAASILELAGGRIRQATGYWGTPFPAQAARARFADGL